MAYQRYKKKYTPYKPKYPRPSEPQSPLAVEVIVVLAKLTGKLFQGLGAGLRWLILRSRKSKPVPPAPLRTAAYPSPPAKTHARFVVESSRTFAPPPSAAPSVNVNDSPSPMPFRPRGGLLSKGERAFWEPLKLAVEGKFGLFAKVRLGDVIACPQNRHDEWRWFRKIKGYHVDFVVCNLDTTAPFLVIELDDRSHSGAKQKRLDAFKDSVLRAAGMPIYRVPAQQAYDPMELAQTIERLINTRRG